MELNCNFVVLILLLVGCDTNPFEPEFTFLDIHLNSEVDSNGYYHIDYDGKRRKQ